MTDQQFKILDKIASGTYSDIYGIRDTDSRELRAMKSIRPEFAGYQVFHSIFRWNTEISNRISHPNIIKNHYFQHEDDHRYFMIMEMIQGFNIFELCSLLPELPHAIKFYIVLEVTRGLGACHNIQVIHRNLSSSNIMISLDGGVKICNFGLSAIEKPDPSDIYLADKNVSFLSPEQIRHIDVNEKSDIWAMGIMMHEIILGNNPFSVNNPNLTIKKICDDVLNIPPDVDPSIAVIIEKCLYKDPEQRYPNIGFLEKDLKAILSVSGLSENDCREELAVYMSELRNEFLPETDETDHEQDTAKPAHIDHTGTDNRQNSRSDKDRDVSREDSKISDSQHGKAGSGLEDLDQDLDEMLSNVFDQTDLGAGKDPVDTVSQSSDSTPKFLLDKEDDDDSGIFFDEHLDETEKELSFDEQTADKTPLDEHIDRESAPIDSQSGLRLHEIRKKRNSDKLLITILLILAGVLAILVLAGDLYNVDNWPLDIINSQQKDVSSFVKGNFTPITAPTESVEIISPQMDLNGMFRFTSTPTPTVIPSPMISPAVSPSVTTFKLLTRTPTPEPLTTYKSQAYQSFLDGQLADSLNHFTKYLSSNPPDRKHLVPYLHQIEAIQSSFKIVNNEIQQGKYRSALVRISRIEKAYTDLAKDMGLPPMESSSITIDGQKIGQIRNSISNLILLLVLPGSDKAPVIYLSDKQIRLNPFKKAYLAYRSIPLSESATLFAAHTANRKDWNIITVESPGTYRNNLHNGIYLYNKHLEPITYSAKGQSKTLPPGQRAFINDPQSITISCGKWGNYSLGGKSLTTGSGKISVIHVIYVK